MASLADIRDKRKFFVLKDNFKMENLCDICRNHKIIMAVKISCDFFIFSNLSSTNSTLRGHKFIHGWCRVDDAPKCFGEYKDAGFVD